MHIHNKNKFVSSTEIYTVCISYGICLVSVISLLYVFVLCSLLQLYVITLKKNEVI